MTAERHAQVGTDEPSLATSRSIPSGARLIVVIVSAVLVFLIAFVIAHGSNSSTPAAHGTTVQTIHTGDTPAIPGPPAAVQLPPLRGAATATPTAIAGASPTPTAGASPTPTTQSPPTATPTPQLTPTGTPQGFPTPTPTVGGGVG